MIQKGPTLPGQLAGQRPISCSRRLCLPAALLWFTEQLLDTDSASQEASSTQTGLEPTHQQQSTQHPHVPVTHRLTCA